VFEYFRTQRKIANLQYRVNYIVRLPVSEVHVLARTDIKKLEDLRGKKVSFGPAGSASSLTGTIVFQRLGIEVEQALVDNPTALQKVRSGELAALVRVIGRPIDFFAKIPANSGLHLVPIPFSKTFADYYTLGEFTSKEYPGLVPEGQSVDTIAVPAVLAVFNWSKGHDRYRRVERFTETLFTKWEKFLEPPPRTSARRCSGNSCNGSKSSAPNRSVSEKVVRGLVPCIQPPTPARGGERVAEAWMAGQPRPRPAHDSALLRGQRRREYESSHRRT
jgi:hypothetical protein